MHPLGSVRDAFRDAGSGLCHAPAHEDLAKQAFWKQVEDSLLRPVWAMPLGVSWGSALWLLPCTPVRSWDPSPVKLSAWAGMAS